MKRLDQLNVEPSEIYDACVSGVEDPVLNGRFAAARVEILASFQEYNSRANSHQLFLSTPSAWGQETQHVLADMTKKEFVDLYSSQMVGSGKPGRKYYDRLMMLAPLGKCPVCGFGQVSTLDHFLSKARYPAFSVLSFNLVPTCTDCNKGKGSSVVTESAQIPHPYFEVHLIEVEPWLFAEVIQSAPATVRYFVQPPHNWSRDLKQRITNYLSDDLSRRFAVEAASELAGLSELLAMMETREEREEHLTRMARVERRIRMNSWKAALYEALSESDWYLNGGYRMLT